MDKDLEVIFVTGGRGTGKTTRVKKLLSDKNRKRIIVYDLKDEYPYKKLKGIREFAKFMKSNWRKSFKVAYVPTAKEKGEHIQELSDLCYILAKAQKADCKTNNAKNLTIVAEEMSLSAPNQKYPSGQGGFEYAVNIAREWGIEIIGVSQRPAQANPDFRGNASKLRTMQPHHYLLAQRGVVTSGKNVLSRKK